MKKFFYYQTMLCALLVCFLVACEKEKEDSEDWLESKDIEYTIPEIYDTVGLSQYNCGDTIDIEGKYVNVKGFVWGLNVFPRESRLMLYPSNNIFDNSGFLDIEVSSADSSDFFSKLLGDETSLSDTTWIEVVIKGEISGWDMAGNGWCAKAFSLIGHDIKLVQ